MPTEKTPLERRTEEIGKWLGVMTLGICLLWSASASAARRWVGASS